MKRTEKQKREQELLSWNVVAFFFSLLAVVLFLAANTHAAPEGPSAVVYNSNTTKTAESALMLNTSGGYITNFNLTATIQNPRWKAYVGQLTGKFTLKDSSGSTIYDWSLATISGEVYATRNASSISWSAIKCANLTILNNESYFMNHTNPDDNITKTFNDTSHASFVVGAITIPANTCPTLNTYINNATQNTDFEEIVLFDGTSGATGGNVVYSTILEENVIGYNNNSYDFQMLVPENGAATWTGYTAYYLYVELS